MFSLCYFIAECLAEANQPNRSRYSAGERRTPLSLGSTGMQIGSSSSLKPQLRFVHVVSIIIGSMIGSGVFKKAAPMAALLGSAPWMLGVWLFAGVISLFGALSLAEIVSMMPQTGGQYRYYRILYGDAFAFVSGWSIFSVIQSGSIAAIAYVFSDYANSIVSLPLLPQSLVDSWTFYLPLLGKIAVLDAIGTKLVSCTVIAILTIVNIRGVRTGGRVATIFSTLKILSLVAIVILCFTSSYGSASHFHAESLQLPAGLGLMGALSLALSKAFWAYDGWGSIAYVGGEIQNPQRSVPRALFLGVFTVIVLYLLVNAAYIFILPIHEMAQSSLVAADVVIRVIGPLGASFIAAAVMISTLGACNGTVLNSARVYYAMAKDGLFFPSMGTVHPRYATPARSLIVQALWSCVLVLSGSFETLTDMLIFVSWIYYGMSAYGVIKLRRTHPDLPRPYRVWGYPYVPVAFIAVSIVFVVLIVKGEVESYMAGSAQTIPSLSGLVICATGLPLYWWFTKRGSRTP